MYLDNNIILLFLFYFSDTLQCGFTLTAHPHKQEAGRSSHVMLNSDDWLMLESGSQDQQKSWAPLEACYWLLPVAEQSDSILLPVSLRSNQFSLNVFTCQRSPLQHTFPLSVVSLLRLQMLWLWFFVVVPVRFFIVRLAHVYCTSTHTFMHESSHIRAHMHTHFYREINKDNGKEWFFFLYLFLSLLQDSCSACSRSHASTSVI